MSNIFHDIESVKEMLRKLRIKNREYCEDEADRDYMEYCEGILDAAISVLGVIRS